jgi:MinD-like ATPase involved in chromosome partitioning or flagellar assembly
MIVSFVSGKGGVGKTALAANFVRICSRSVKCLLIDLDLSNQGMTGLLAQFLTPECYNSYKFLHDTDETSQSVLRVSHNLYFLPAFDPGNHDRFAYHTNELDPTTFPALLDKLTRLCDRDEFDLVIIDCHGGLETASLIGFALGDTAVVVTEADVVSFNGTLELIDFYQNRVGDSDPQTKCSSPVSLLTERTRNKLKVSTTFVVNRVTGRFDYGTLQSTYKRQMTANFNQVQPNFFFIPNDPFLAESFSEYPFYVDLLPESIFCQKLELLIKQTLGLQVVIPGRSRFFRLFEKKGERRLIKYIQSGEERRAQVVYSFVGVLQILLLIVIGVGITIFANDPSLLDLGISEMFGKHPLVFTVTNLVVSGVSVMAAFTNIYISRFYRDRLRYEFRLMKRGIERVDFTFTLRSLRSLITRATLLLFCIIFLSYGILNGFAVTRALIGFPILAS